MKKIYRLLLLPLAVMMWACSDNVIDDLSGTYDNIRRYNFNTETTQETTKLKKGLKILDMIFADDSDNTFYLKVISREWTLQPGVYTPMESVGEEPKANRFYGFVANGDIANGAITAGDLEVSMIGTDYNISGILTGGDGKRYVIGYRGPISFEIGVDDPEPSGYTMSVKIDPVTVTDFTTWQTTVIPGVSKYSLTISDPSGEPAAFFEAINKEGMTAEQLCGTYTIAGSPAEAWLIDNGWISSGPGYHMTGGAFVMSPSGEKQFITKGNITIAAVDGITGEKLYGFTGENLSYITEAGGSGSTNLGIRFVSLLRKHGTEKLDIPFRSEVLGREVTYSVLLPESFDGQKEYPLLYILHGAAGNNNDWFVQGGIGYHTGNVENEMVIVSVQASFDGFDSFYTDNYKGKGLSYETFFTTEFMPAIEDMYRCNGKRGIAGLSMGGFGTLYYGIKYGDRFAGMYACSPALSNGESVNIGDMLQTPGLKPFVVEIGTEDFLYDNVKWLKDVAQYLPMMSYIERPGAHDWPFWSACAPKIITFFDTLFAE